MPGGWQATSAPATLARGSLFCGGGERSRQAPGVPRPDLGYTGGHTPNAPMESRPAGKSQRKRLQRQLEFYLGESNLRQDKFLQQAMDEQGFVPVRVFLSFNKLKTLKATERMILDEAEKSSLIRVDRSRSCIAPKVLPVTGEDNEADARTIYIDSFGTADDHDSLRRTFAKFGKVNLVSLPRFPQSKKFKGFGFVEFAEQRAAEEAVAGASDGADLRGIRAMSKRRWLEMKEQLKLRLSCSDTSEGNTCSAKADDANASDDPNKCAHLVSRTATDKKLKKKRQKPASGGHIHFGDGDSDEQPANSDSNDNQEASAKKQKL
ncbi:la-related protein 7-like [Phytophthora cinnamomi]|uniref:la-related protein 7-like n=1 Tax=Phytophthora cinnamomi TaxID=4785 RepID=UPI003559705D|nr:la-related protein 7-like [Phytophthora cinnamomi]